MNNEFANIIKHSRSPRGCELITIEIEIPRVILAENNTHRSLSRNYQSSRACPVAKQIEQVQTRPYLPFVYGKNKSGMQSEDVLSPEEQAEAERIILDMRDYCLAAVKKLSDKDGLNGHKQWVNRYIEPWLYTKGLVTATRDAWSAWSALRYHKDADPALYEVAKHVTMAINNSVPTDLEYGQWHLPYIENINKALHLLIRISVSCSAQVSFRVLDDSLEKAKRIYDMLNLPENGIWKEDLPHFSCAEHQALCYDGDLLNTNVDRSDIGGNFQTREWYQYRKMLEQGQEKEMMELEQES